MTDPTPQPVINYAGPGAAVPRGKPFRNLFGWVLFIGLAVLLFVVLQGNRSASVEVSLSEFTDQLSNGNVSEVVIDGDSLRCHLVKPIVPAAGTRGARGGSAAALRVELPPTMSQNWTFVRWLLDQRQQANVRVENNPNLLVNLIVPLIPWILIFAFIWFFVFRALRAQQQQRAVTPIPVYIVPPENR